MRPSSTAAVTARNKQQRQPKHQEPNNSYHKQRSRSETNRLDPKENDNNNYGKDNIQTPIENTN